MDTSPATSSYYSNPYDVTATDGSSSVEDNPSITPGVIYFHIADYVVLVLMLLFSLAIGVYYGCSGGKQKSTAEYFQGNQNMSLLPVVMSLMASFISSNGMLGVPIEVYYFGFNYIWVIIGSVCGIPIAAYLFLPVFYDLKITSIFEYLERRFNRTVRLCGSVLTIICTLIWSSFVIYGPSLALSQVTGMSLWGSIVATTFIGIIYTSIGGIKAVMWSDSLQLVVFVVAIIVAIVKGTIDTGGMSYIIEKAKEGRRIEMISFDFDLRIRFTFWGFLISTTLGWINGYGISQIQLQRYQSCSTKARAQRSLWLNLPGMIIVLGTYCFIGLVLYARYWDCDPLLSQQIRLPDQAFPLFVMQTMGSLPGLPGLFTAGVYSASLSTTSSVLNSLAAITLEDYVRPRYPNLTDERATNVSKLIAVAYGLVCLVVVAGISNLGTIVEALGYLVGGTFGANFGLFTLGLFFPWANPRGTILGVVIGVAITSWFSLGNQIYKPPSPDVLPMSTEGCNQTLGNWTMMSFKPQTDPDSILEVYKISYFWMQTIAWFLTVVIGALVSPLIGSHEKEVDPALFSPAVHYFQRKFGRNKGIPVPTKEPPPAYAETEMTPMMDKGESTKKEDISEYITSL